MVRELGGLTWGDFLCRKHPFISGGELGAGRYVFWVYYICSFQPRQPADAVLVLKLPVLLGDMMSMQLSIISIVYTIYCLCSHTYALRPFRYASQKHRLIG